MKLNPIKLDGVWNEGYALDYFTTKSEYKGEDIFGYPEFDVTYSEIGKALNELKYHKDYLKAVEIADEIADHITNEWNLLDKIDGIIAVPPSKPRIIQPLFQLVKLVGEKVKKPISLDFFSKLTPEEIKNLPVEKKLDLFKNSIRKNRDLTRKGNILLIDDLYSTGTTLKSLCTLLKDDTNVENIYVLVVAKSSIDDK